MRRILAGLFLGLLLAGSPSWATSFTSTETPASLGLVVGTNVQAYSSTLNTIAGGGVVLASAAQSTSYSLLATDFAIVYTVGSGGTVTLTLPSVFVAGQEWRITRADNGSSSLLIQRFDSGTSINGASSVTMSTSDQYKTYILRAMTTTTMAASKI